MSQEDVEEADFARKTEPLDPPLPSPISSHEEEEHEESLDQQLSHDIEKAPSHHEPNDQTRPELSRTVSAQSKPLSLKKVPVSKRSGLFARLSFLYEADEPKAYPRKVKWLITFIISLAAVAAPMGSSIILRM